MKKQLTAIVLCIVLVFASMLCGCMHESESEKIRNGYKIDGCLKYYYLEEEDRYLIVGDIGEYNPETMVIPAYYKGKEVQVGYKSKKDWLSKVFAPSYLNVECVYFPFANYDDESFFHATSLIVKNTIKKIFFCSNFEFLQAENYLGLSKESIIYFSYPTFLKRMEISSNYTTEKMHLEGSYTMVISSRSRQYRIRVANTAYMFNYDGEPNGGYFFINNFDWGKKIDPAPYMPMRNGYEFKGWYKEPECINLWNFDSDSLPQESEIGENPETKLYAGWEKKSGDS